MIIIATIIMITSLFEEATITFFSKTIDSQASISILGVMTESATSSVSESSGCSIDENLSGSIALGNWISYLIPHAGKMGNLHKVSITRINSFSGNVFKCLKIFRVNVSNENFDTWKIEFKKIK